MRKSNEIADIPLLSSLSMMRSDHFLPVVPASSLTSPLFNTTLISLIIELRQNKFMDLGR
jgi:hypothetical protein